METDSQMNFTVGGNFAGGKGNVVLNAQFESIGQVFYDQANDRLYNCESGFFFRNPADTGQQMYAVAGTVYPPTLQRAGTLVKQMLKVNVLLVITVGIYVRLFL